MTTDATRRDAIQADTSARITRAIHAAATPDKSATLSALNGQIAVIQRDALLAILRDISFGAEVMLQLGNTSALGKYATEVKRVADIAIAGVRPSEPTPLRDVEYGNVSDLERDEVQVTP